MKSQMYFFEWIVNSNRKFRFFHLQCMSTVVDADCFKSKSHLWSCLLLFFEWIVNSNRIFCILPKKRVQKLAQRFCLQQVNKTWWSRGDDVSFTPRRSWVRFPPSWFTRVHAAVWSLRSSGSLVGLVLIMRLGSCRPPFLCLSMSGFLPIVL